MLFPKGESPAKRESEIARSEGQASTGRVLELTWLLLVSLEHELPERLDLFNMAALTVHRHSSQQESFCEFAFQADLLRMGRIPRGGRSRLTIEGLASHYPADHMGDRLFMSCGSRRHTQPCPPTSP